MVVFNAVILCVKVWSFAEHINWRLINACLWSWLRVPGTTLKDLVERHYLKPWRLTKDCNVYCTEQIVPFVHWFELDEISFINFSANMYLGNLSRSLLILKVLGLRSRSQNWILRLYRLSAVDEILHKRASLQLPNPI